MASTITTDMDLSKLKVPELRKELKLRNLSTTGNKNELLERLQAAMKGDKSEEVTDAASVDDLEEDLLNEEDDESHIGENDSVLQDIDETLDKSPTETKSLQGTKRKSGEGTTNGSVKKIVLNRSSTTDIADDLAVNGVKNSEVEKQPIEKKVIKLSELSAKERLEMRAKKFGTPLSGEAKKEVRAERFGIKASTGSDKTKITTETKAKSTPIVASAPASADVLRQRAERFGVKTSTTLTKLENQEKLDKRKARFGITTTTTTTNGAESTLNKAQQRLERFKQPVK